MQINCFKFTSGMNRTKVICSFLIKPLQFNLHFTFVLSHIVQMPTKTHGNASQYQSAYTSGQHGSHNFASGNLL